MHHLATHIRRAFWVAILAGSLSGATVRAQAPSIPILPPAQGAESPAAAAPIGRQPATEVAPHMSLAPWWSDAVRSPLDTGRNPVAMELDAAIFGVLSYSPQVRVAADAPVIRQTFVTDAAARFDPRAFADSKFTDTSDPVGNLLTTGGATRFIDQTWISSGGIRQSNTFGGQFEAAQKFGWQDNNSDFFIPKNQGTSRITLTYTQPLLNGSGRLYNTSMICLAEISVDAASAQMVGDLQRVLLDTHKAYWELRLQRAALLQRIRLKQSAVDIQNELRGRADFDVVRSQIVRADAAVATRDAGVIRFGTEVANAETRLRALINDPSLQWEALELVPTMAPYHELLEPNLQEIMTVALESRPEVKQGFAEIRAAALRADVGKNDLLPVFNVLLGTYVYGLQGESDIAQSWVDQFSQGRPTYWTGLQFEYPLHNRGANARLTQRRVELRQATNRLQQTLVQIRAETEVAVREVTTTYREMVSRYQAMQADQAEIEYLTSRWRLATDDQQLAGVVLNDLLDAQERLAQAEYDFAAAEAAYNVALISLNAVTGTLLQAEGVRIHESILQGLPTLNIESPGLQPRPVDGGAPAAPPDTTNGPVPQATPPAQPQTPAAPTVVAMPPVTDSAAHPAGQARLTAPEFATPPLWTPLPPVAELPHDLRR